MTIKLFFFFTLFASSALLVNVNAQGTFSTTNGTIQIATLLNGESLIAKSNFLVVVINYESAHFEIRLDKSTLRTGVDSLDEKLKDLRGELLIFQGKLGVEFVQTQSHPPQDFEVAGYLTCAPHYDYIVGRGHLEHIFDGVYSCILNMSFDIDLREMMIDIGLAGLSNEIHVEIVQTVLKNEYE